MAVDPMMDAMAQKLAAGRAGRQMPPQMVEEALPEEAPGGLAEVRALLQQAMDLIDGMGGGEVV